MSEPLAAGATIGLAPTQAHYLRHVLRLSAGERIALFNGRDGEWEAAIAGFGKGWASVEVARRRRAQRAEPDLWLLFAPVKRARIDYLVQKAAELGVSVLQPVFTEYTAVGRVNGERLAANAVEAAQQSGRLSVPEVRAPVPVMEALGAWPAGRRLLWCDESGGGAPVAAALAGAARGGPWAVLIGPEGGFAPAELDAIRKLPFVTAVSLGPRLLRADTAAVAALACWQAWLGDWRDATPDA
ncbi:MAG TPA: 16S rRNA (uracil(1498)-N(3))-methyltransferase [Alphaproteobacteria bacterium]